MHRNQNVPKCGRRLEGGPRHPSVGNHIKVPPKPKWSFKPDQYCQRCREGYKELTCASNVMKNGATTLPQVDRSDTSEASLRPSILVGFPGSKCDWLSGRGREEWRGGEGFGSFQKLQSRLFLSRSRSLRPSLLPPPHLFVNGKSFFCLSPLACPTNIAGMHLAMGRLALVLK